MFLCYAVEEKDATTFLILFSWNQITYEAKVCLERLTEVAVFSFPPTDRGRRLRGSKHRRGVDDGRSRLHPPRAAQRPVARGDAEADPYGNPGRETPQFHAASRQQPTRSPRASRQRGAATT